VSLTAPASVTHTVAAPIPEDLLQSNNSGSVTVTVKQPPTPTIGLSASSVTGGQQQTVSVSISSALPQDVTGTLVLSFTSTATNPADDPAIQFASGGRVVSFVIPANTLQARFGSFTTASPISFQTGTVAGAISFSGNAQEGLSLKSFSTTPNALAIVPGPPVIQSSRTSTQDGFAFLITSFSTVRSMSEVALQFNTFPAVQLSCGGVAGCTASGTTMTFDVKSLFDAWFNGNSQSGGLSTLRLPMTIPSSIHGGVNITLRNSAGGSNLIFMTLP